MIWKHRIERTSTLQLPLNCKPLCVQVQRGQACLWEWHENDTEETEAWDIRVEGTGYPDDLDESWLYFGTFQLYGGDLVFHAFGRKQVRA